MFQEDLQVTCKRSDADLVGFIEMGPECDALYYLRHCKYFSDILIFCSEVLK